MNEYLFYGTKNYYDEDEQEDRIAEFKAVIIEDNIKKAVRLFESLFDEDIWNLTLKDGTKTTEYEWQEINEVE